MEINTSKKYSLDKKDWGNIWKTILAIYSPVIIVFLDQIQEMVFDYKILVALAISVTVDIIRRFIADNRKNILATIKTIDKKEFWEYIRKEEKKEEENKK